MNNRLRIGAAGFAALVIGAAIASLSVGYGPYPITAWNRVYYSAGGEWLDFYAERAPEETGWIHLPEPSQGGQFESEVDPFLKGFVKMHVCGECHPDQFDTFSETAHYRTSAEATPETVLGSFTAGENRLTTRDPHLHFEMLAQDEGLYQKVVVNKEGKRYEHRERFDIVTGSGNHGQTYLYWHGDRLCQLPVSYFSESGGWINSPGFYRDGTADFARGIGGRCLACHATYFASAPNAFNRYDRDDYILGVTCVRCHGPGWAHVQYHRTHPSDTQPRYIVHPGKLPRERANEVCAQCHSGVGRPLREAYSYQPGEPLDQFLELDPSADNPSNDDPHAANQLARLMKSRCFQESESMTCATCHNPHQNERGELKLFAQRCAACHQDDCHVAAEHGVQIAEKCVECHMPSRRDHEGAMQTRQGELLPLLRDHFIKVWPQAAQRVLEKNEAEKL